MPLLVLHCGPSQNCAQKISAFKNSWYAPKVICQHFLRGSDLEIFVNSLMCLTIRLVKCTARKHYNECPILESVQTSAHSRYCKHTAKFPVCLDGIKFLLLLAWVGAVKL